MNKEIVSPLKTIRAHCLECSDTANEVRRCPCTQCRLYPYRLGHDPRKPKKMLSEEERKKIRQGFARKKTPSDKGEIHEETNMEGDSNER